MRSTDLHGGPTAEFAALAVPTAFLPVMVASAEAGEPKSLHLRLDSGVERSGSALSGGPSVPVDQAAEPIAALDVAPSSLSCRRQRRGDSSGRALLSAVAQPVRLVSRPSCRVSAGPSACSRPVLASMYV